MGPSVSIPVASCDDENVFAKRLIQFAISKILSIASITFRANSRQCHRFESTTKALQFRFELRACLLLHMHTKGVR